MPKKGAPASRKRGARSPSASVGFLGGGNMAGALILGLIQSKAITPSRILASDVKKERLAHLSKTYGIHVTMDNHALVRDSEIVVLSVKPQVVDKVLSVIGPDIRKDQLVVSIAAGVPISALEARLPAGTRVVRTMPNVAALALAGATAISGCGSKLNGVTPAGQTTVSLIVNGTNSANSAAVSATAQIALTVRQ